MPPTEPTDTTAAATRGGTKGRVRRSLLELNSQRKETTPAVDHPIEFTENNAPSVSIGIVTEEMEFVTPYIPFGPSVRVGEQYSIALGEWELTLLLDNEVANAKGWESPAQDISRGIHAQTIAWIHHRPEWGLTVQVTKREPEKQ